ncbi:hypothetical protein GBA52_003801 [Prunus armeniaca]|nr:hypothetical protein GBA52_003801 [Prunus armeniaca]
MVHLTVYLIREMCLCGPVHSRWMYPFERFIDWFSDWCAWVESSKSITHDEELGFTLVNLSRRGHRNDEFVMATQVKQVFYIDNPKKVVGIQCSSGIQKVCVIFGINQVEAVRLKLTSDHVLLNKNNVEALKNPLAMYDFILKKHWQSFVISRLSRPWQIEKKEIYANEEIDRAELWKKAHQDKNGKNIDQGATKVAKKIYATNKKSYFTQKQIDVVQNEWEEFMLNQMD